MRKFLRLFFCIFIIQFSTMSAQTDWCGTLPLPDLPATGWDSVDQTMIDSDLSNLPRYVFNVRFWDVNKDNGDNDEVLTETQALDQIARLNRDFNFMNIFFKYTGISPLDEEAFTEIDFPNDEWAVFFDYINSNGQYYEVGNINIYSVDEIFGPTGAYYVREPNGLSHTIVSEDIHITDSHVLTHEMGHYFFLRHVFDPLPLTIPLYENVTRDITDSCYNADDAGDEVIDTNATPENMQYDPNDCTYISQGEVDSCGVAYNAFGLEPEVKNFMSYANACADEMIFTPGQIARMHLFLDVWDHHPSVLLYDSVHESVLYEPYRGVYLGGLNCTDPPLFQYGFDYTFYDTSQAATYNQPATYEDTSFWYGQITNSYSVNHNAPIEHLDHTAFVIEQLEDGPPRKCWNTGISSLTSGCVISFIDGVPNGNYTVAHKDSLGINSPTLIEDLQPGLYNIQANHLDGTTEQTMILKESN